MNKIQRCVSILIPIIALTALTPVVLAAPVELSLDESIALALKNNYNIKYYNSAREKSYWALKEAEKNKGVSVTYTHTDERYNTPPSVLYGTDSYTYTNDFDNTVALSVPIYSGKKLEGEIDEANLALKEADLDVAVAKQQLKLDVITDYFNVLEYRNEAAVDQATVDNYKEHLDLVNAKFDIGMVAKTDVLTSQVDLADAQDTLIQAQNSYHNAVATLNNAIGLSHGTELVLKDEFKYEKYPLTLEQCLQYAEEHRPEIAQYEAKVTSAKDAIQVAKSGYLPTVDLTAEQGWYDSHLPGAKNSNWLVKLTTSINLFDTGLTDSQVKQAQHNVDMVSDQAKQERDSILLNVRQYYLSMGEAEKRIETSKVSVNQAEENLRIEKERYKVGVDTNLDLRDAVLSLDSAKKTAIKALYDFNTYRAELEQAMGIPVK
ncbi:outer membrane efflux protein [Lucifera butyrica]|uniref:Outer membrane efflux protein n=1 Tax=Lucifera butyrica TaxID=1351585 RepID=A0A498RFR3_9FIRM|nr:TolC family protein [Lucifera butyrica]VBB08933.1 outer membrane efflux protein [Lucifera butyrica]